jgi:hypothetical protein
MLKINKLQNLAQNLSRTWNLLVSCRLALGAQNSPTELSTEVVHNFAAG